MGAWGASLYSDDTTCDVRDSFVTHLKHGKTGEEAIQAILDDYGNSLESHEVQCLVFFALADTAWKYGRLTSQLRDRALELIDCGGDVYAWEEDSPQDAPARRKVLDKLRTRLLSAQPDQKHIKLSPPKPKRIISNDLIGSVFLLKLPSQGKIAMVLVDHLDTGDSIQPIFSVPGWRGEGVPTQDELLRASHRILTFSSGLGDKKHVGILCLDNRKNPMKPLEKTHLFLPQLPYNGGCVFVSLHRIAQEAEAQLGGACPDNSFKPTSHSGAA
jgi:hypothetical protein